ncbi:hypothetical protein BS47DRAFT_175529 [Hydnum rufescens UP504]|uniref:Uncharacterized protein n=1 Tax=Hydnum rufescens UP504 TaxID=1448309 RepID=A0A9P6APV3_9AGAM|nr:hypothetical protein BS47DRAFT_175529 [Hydnum rufescens UP504]
MKTRTISSRQIFCFFGRRIEADFGTEIGFFLEMWPSFFYQKDKSRGFGALALDRVILYAFPPSVYYLFLRKIFWGGHRIGLHTYQLINFKGRTCFTDHTRNEQLDVIMV